LSPLTSAEVTLRAELEGLLEQQDWDTRRGHDPIAFPHRYARAEDREIVAVFAACLAYGRADLIARGMEQVVARMGDHPARAAEADDEAAARARFDGFVYRLTRGEDLARLWLGVAALRRNHGSLGAAMAHFDDPGAPDLRPALTGVRAGIRAATPGFADRKAFAHFFPDPQGASACKRLHMFLRWMVRGPDAVDFGDWAGLGAHRLLMPLDTHVHRLGRYLDLTARTQADRKTAVEITAALRRLDPADPLRYDFALAHLGISGACPTRRVPDICAGCAIRRICQLS
jgi:uncharacterized protein (TIGR02757 family)